ncbi:MAG: hypothetical protein APR62_12995 [Smithella sp. SDB]|nr:MAG: hypothetical protein APR62_12995 [Smithella sp. SDB]
MNKGRVSTQILLCVLMMLLLISGCTNTSDDFIVASSAPNTYSISGTVSGTTGVTINLTGASTASVTTDSSGTFTITGLASGEYTITPVKTDFKFTPSSAAVTVSGGVVTVPDFVATADTSSRYSISGTVSGDVKYQVLVTLGGDGSATTKTDTSGNYTFSNLVAGNYTLTPSLAGYTFSPSSLSPTVSANITGQNFTATAVPVSYDQADLEGIWNMNVLRKGASRNEWERLRISVDSGGVASCIYYGSSTKVLTAQDNLASAIDASDTTLSLTNGAMPTGAVVVQIGDEKISGTYNSSTKEITSCTRGYDGTTAEEHSAGAVVTETRNDPTGQADCPSPFDLTLTMAGGVVTPSGTTASELGISHMTMTSSKNLIAGTGTSTDSSYQLAVMQKEVTGTVYTNSDVYNKNFVYHQLQVGKINQWERATGQTDSGGAIRLTSLTSPSGSASDMPKSLGVTFVLNTDTGRVDMSGTVYASFQGFLSDDKKTIVGTYTDNIENYSEVDSGQNDYHLIIFQMDDQTYIADALPGTYVSHFLGIGSQYGWGYFTTTVAGGGGMTFSDFHTSNGSFTIPATTSGSIGASGVVTISGISSYHGQMSYDGKFIVGTKTLSTGIYALQIDTK